MKTQLDYSNILEFNRIKEMLTTYAETDAAKERLAKLMPIMSEAKLSRAAKDTDGARKIIDFAGNPHIPNTAETRFTLDAAEKGGMLDPERLEKLAKFTASCRRLKAYLKKAEATEQPIAFCGDCIDPLDELFSEINRCVNNGEVLPTASKALSELTRKIENAKSAVRVKLDELVKSHKECFSDSFVSVRNGRFTLPVKREYKTKIGGSVIAVSSSGTTLFIEPPVAAKYSEQLSALEVQADAERDRILYTLTVLADKYAAEIKLNADTAETLDFSFAKAKLGAELKAVTPTINTERRMKIAKGRHPLLSRDIVVPTDFEIGGEIRGIVVTGPNTGGKTVALKLVGLFSLMAQCGLQLPCESADIPLCSGVLCDIGDGQNISENLSTFSAHIKSITDILSVADKNALVLLDELGSGTDPAEGMGIAVAILEELRARHCLFVATTHYAEVKAYAEEADGLINARMTFDKETLRPQYRLVIGEAGESCAFYIAKRLGFPERLLKTAYEQTYGKRSTNKKLTPPPVDDLFSEEGTNEEKRQQPVLPAIEKAKRQKTQSEHALGFNLGDGVVVYPERKNGIIFKQADEDGTLGVIIQGKKLKVNHKRVKLKTPASALYPPDYDFSIVFDTVENRKARHSMDRKFDPNAVIVYDKED